MSSDLLGEGEFGTVQAERVAVKTYSEIDFCIARDAIREASILNHLNDHSVKGVPRLYSIDSILNSDHRTTTTSSIMSLGGRSLKSLILETDDLTERCKIFERYLDKILQVIGEIHKSGVIHNDLNIGNILIGEHRVDEGDDEVDDEVIIIDFGLSTFNDVYDIGLAFTTPEYYRYKKNVYTSDYWTLAAIIVNVCTRSDHVPILREDWEDITMILEVKHTLDELKNQEVHTGVIIPSLITPSLAEKLRPLLQYNHLDRGLVVREELTLSKFKPALNRDYYNAISSTINYMALMFKEYFNNDHPSYLGVAIDILRRILVPLGGIERSQNVIKLIVLAIAMIVGNDPIPEMVKVNNHTIEEVNVIEVKILSILRWRVFTESNVRLSNHGDITMLCDKVIEDKNRHLLMEMSDEELYKYFRD